VKFENPFYAHSSIDQLCVYVGSVAILGGGFLIYWGYRGILKGEVVHYLYPEQSMRTEIYSRSDNRLAFWNVVMGRIGMGVLFVLFGIGIACFRAHAG